MQSNPFKYIQGPKKQEFSIERDKCVRAEIHLFMKVIHKASQRCHFVVSCCLNFDSQAHGQGQDFSSAENSDSSADEDFRATNPVTKVAESVYWADSEEEKEDKGDVAVKSGKEKVKCFG